MKRVTNLEDSNMTFLLESSRAEGYRFIQRLSDEYESGTNRFNKQGELLYMVEREGKVIGVGGLNIDPYANDKDIGRLRHIYIAPEYRGLRLGKQLVEKLIEEARAHFTTLRLYTENTVADQLYCSMGFNEVEGHHKATHILKL